MENLFKANSKGDRQVKYHFKVENENIRLKCGAIWGICSTQCSLHQSSVFIYNIELHLLT